LINKIPLGLLLIAILLSSACNLSNDRLATMVAAAQTATAGSWTSTFTATYTETPTLTDTPTFTFTPTETPTPSETPTETFTPTFTFTPSFTPTFTFTPSPTFSFPHVMVDMKYEHAACMWGPSTEYLWGWDLNAGDTGTVYGRSPYNKWLYVKMDRVDKWCWIGPLIADLTGDPSRLKYMDKNALLPMTNALYNSPPIGHCCS
jgi:hypothetical protein